MYSLSAISREDIKDILDNVDVDIECFIHGAMCASYSGRCVLSNFLPARDANRGGCSQICRWDFNLYGDNKELKGNKDFTFCTKDLSMLKVLPEMIEMGITSFKIEGRMRSIYYVATIVNIYRKAIDEYFNDKENYKYNEEYEKVLNNCANRESTVQFFLKDADVTTQYYNGREELSNQDFLGLVLDYNDKTKIVTIEQRNYFKKGDIIEMFGPEIEPFTFEVKEIFDEDNNTIDIVRHPKQIVSFKLENKVYPFDMMRIKK